ncbi:MAG: glycosyltransferase family 39 protein [Holophagales bacterium]|nr:glycosyltransferase family 39 protein [Holophagales bacterium]
MLGVLLALALVADDRHVGAIADGRQMIRTAVAISETGEIGQARGRDFTIERPAGDAVSRFGMGTSLLQVPAAWLAPRIEASRGPGSSQALFLLVPWLAVGVAAFAAGSVARRLGGGHPEVVAAALLASVASPLGSYAQLEFSEPVQAAALAVALAAALAAVESPTPRRGLEMLAGFAAGFAVLVKSSLIVAAPAALLPLVARNDVRRTRGALAWKAIGAIPPLALWVVFELARFGRLFGGYPDDRFTHPWFDGLWRLLVGPNRGLLLFWPALVLFLWAGAKYRGAWLATPGARAWCGALWVLAAQVAVAAGYWGWHGMEGWGPRLVLAAIPLLAPFAALALGPARRAWLAAVVGVCLLVNLPPLLQHPTPVATYEMNLAWPDLAPEEVADYPFYARGIGPAGEPTVVPFARLELEPAANPWRLYLWVWRASQLEGAALSEWLTSPPWAGRLPALVPAERWPPEVARRVVPPARWGFLGRSLTGGGGPYATVDLDALLDQAVRANQLGRTARALELSSRVAELSTGGEAAAWRLESLRRANRGAEAERYLRSLSRERRADPRINVVLALFDRDAGEERRARALLGSVASAFPGAALQDALEAPLDRWPTTLDAMTRSERRDAAVAAPIHR